VAAKPRGTVKSAGISRRLVVNFSERTRVN
jgi:hypothetical protein